MTASKMRLPKADSEAAFLMPRRKFVNDLIYN